MTKVSPKRWKAVRLNNLIDTPSLKHLENISSATTDYVVSLTEGTSDLLPFMIEANHSSLVISPKLSLLLWYKTHLRKLSITVFLRLYFDLMYLANQIISVVMGGSSSPHTIRFFFLFESNMLSRILAQDTQAIVHWDRKFKAIPKSMELTVPQIKSTSFKDVFSLVGVTF